jgi:hypothetical protein
MITAPTNISDCVVWLDGADFVATMGQEDSTGTGDVTDRTQVGLWVDKTTGKRFVQSGSKPVFNQSLKCVDFDYKSRDNTLVYSNFTNPIVYTEQTTFAVVELTDGQNQDGIYTQTEFLSSSLQGYTPLIIGSSPDSAGRILVGSQANYERNNSIQASYSGLRPYPNELVTLCSRHTGTTILNFHNGRPGTNSNSVLNENAVGTSTVGVLSATTTQIGGWNFYGRIFEIISYKRALSDVEIRDVTYYLSRKWSSVKNVIPRAVYPTQDGNWSAINWSINGEPAPYNTIQPTDNIYPYNGYTVDVNNSVKIKELEHRDPFSGTTESNYGTFRLTDGITLSADIINTSRNLDQNLPSHRFLTLTPTASSTIVGTFYTSTGGIKGGDTINNHMPVTLSADGVCSLTIKGDVTGYNEIKSNAPARIKAIEWASSGDLKINGNIVAGYPYQRALIDVTGAANVHVNGNIYGHNEPDTFNYTNIGGSYTYGAIRLRNTSTGSMWITGNVYAGKSADSYGILTEGSNSLFLSGNVYNLQTGANSITYGLRANSTTTGVISITGDVFGGQDTFNDTSNGGIYNSGNQSIRVFGNVYGGNSSSTNHGIYSTNGDIQVFGNAIARGSTAIKCTSLTVPLSVFYTDSGIINGVSKQSAAPAINARAFRIYPNYSPATNFSQFTDAEGNNFYYWPSSKTFSLPSLSDVIKGFNYSSFTGDCAVPSPSAVVWNTRVGSPVTITNLVSGERYEILTNDGITTFLDAGAPFQYPGTRFTALCSLPFGTSTAFQIGKLRPYETGMFWNTQMKTLSASGTMGTSIKKSTTSSELTSVVAHIG